MNAVKPKTILLPGILLSVACAQAQQQPVMQWSAEYDGPNHQTDIIAAYALDCHGNTYATGYSSIIGLTSVRRITTIRYSPSGQLTLFERYDSSATGDRFATSIVVDDSGAATVAALGDGDNPLLIRHLPTGSIDWVIRFPMYAVTPPIVVRDSVGDLFLGVSSGKMICIWKFNAHGIALDSTTISGDTTSLSLNAMVASNRGDLYVVGNRTYSHYDGTGLPVIYEWGELVNLDNHCHMVWQKIGGAISGKVRIDRNGNLVLIGGGSVMKYSSEGTLLWQVSPGMSLADCAIDSRNDVLVNGFTTSPSVISHVCKYDVDGNLLWDAKLAERTVMEYVAMAVDSADNIYVTGNASGLNGGADCLTDKLDSSGNKLWGTVYPKPADEDAEGVFIGIGDSGSVYVGGSSGTTYNQNYLVIKYSQASSEDAIEPFNGMPLRYQLDQNYPNPFNPSTTIRYALSLRSHVTLSVYNTLGQLVSTLVSGEEEPGYHEVRFDGSNVASGVYFYRLQAGGYVRTMRMLVLH